MNRRLPLLAFAVVLSLGCAFLWKSISGPGGEKAEQSLSGPGSAEESLVPEVAALPSAPEVAPAPQTSKREVAAQAAQPKAASTALVIPDDSLWYEGRLIFPDKVPLEESFRVVASGRRFGKDRKAPRKHTVEAQADGRFRVAFAKKTSTGYVGLEARYMYLVARERVKPKEGPREIVLKPLVGGVLQGRIMPPVGHEAGAETFEGVRVRVSEWSQGTSFSKMGEVLPDGSYEVLGLAPSSNYSVSLITNRFSGEDRDNVILRVGEITELDLALRLGVHLEGRVQDSSGEPLQGTRVNLMVTTQNENGGISSSSNNMVTDKEGKFTFAGLKPGTMTISVRAPGATEIVDELGELENGVRRTDLLYSTSAGNSVSGIARWQDGTPAAGVSIDARTLESNGTSEWNARTYHAKTDEAGAFTLTGLDERTLVLDAKGRRVLGAKKGLLGRKKRGPTLSARVVDVKPGMRGIQVLMAAGEVLRGTVLFANGGSVGSFFVSARPDWNNRGALDWSDRVERKFSAEDGEYELTGLKPGAWNISVKGKGFAESDGTVVQIPYEGQLDFTVSPASSMTGTVVTPTGEPLAGAEITLIEIDGDTRSWSSGGAKTASDGVFRLKGLEPGRYELRTTVAAWAPSDNLPVTLAAGEDREGLVIVVNPAARLTGQVLPAAGEVADRHISAWGQGFSESAVSDSTGRFEFDNLGPGNYTVTLNQKSSEEDDWHIRRANSISKDVELVAGGTVHIELGDGPEAPIRVFGKVLSGGVGVAGYSVSFHDAKRDKSTAVRTDDGGAYSATVDGAGSYAVTVRPPSTKFGANYNVFHIKVAAEGEQREDFHLPTASLELTLVRPDGSAGAAVLVGLRALDVPSLKDNVSSDEGANEDGRFVFRHLEPGKYRYRVGGDLNWGEDGGDFARKSWEIQIGAGATEKRQVRLEDGGRVLGLVTYADGTPASGLKVEAFNSAGEELTVGYQSTDDTGRFDIGGLPSGSVRINIGHGQSAVGERTLQVSQGASHQTEITVNR